jgi:hypothetical protein
MDFTEIPLLLMMCAAAGLRGKYLKVGILI